MIKKIWKDFCARIKLVVRITRAELKKEKLETVVPIPKRTTTLNSWLKPQGTAKVTNGNSQFTPAPEKPSKSQVKKLVGLTLGVAVKQTMTKHFYSIAGEYRRQLKGGAIGSDATGEAARLYMITWDSKLKTKLKTLGITTHLYSRYVDDILCVIPAVNKGWTYDKHRNRMVFDAELARTDTSLDDERTATVISQIANSIETNIQFTVDYPSRNENGRMAVLDLEIWIQDYN